MTISEDLVAATAQLKADAAALHSIVYGELRSANFVALPNIRYDVDTSVGALIALLSGSPPARARFYFNDLKGSWGTNTFTIDGNGLLFEGGFARVICRQAASFSIVVDDGVLKIR